MYTNGKNNKYTKSWRLLRVVRWLIDQKDNTANETPLYQIILGNNETSFNENNSKLYEFAINKSGKNGVRTTGLKKYFKIPI